MDTDGFLAKYNTTSTDSVRTKSFEPMKYSVRKNMVNRGLLSGLLILIHNDVVLLFNVSIPQVI